MKFLICGIGSIGQRHYKNLHSLGHELAVFRSSKNNTSFVDKFIKEQEEKGGPIKMYYNLDEALSDFNPVAVFITNPNSAHMNIALTSARAGKHLFIEKPISHSIDGIKELQSLAKEKDLKIMVGYNLRWYPLLQKMKKMFDEGEIGHALSANVEMGENIEDWHQWENYRDVYASYKSGGGGAVLCFSHDIDYLYWFLGKPSKIYAVGGKITPLDGDAEDMVKALFEYNEGHIASIHIDYWQRPHRRIFEIVGTKGKLIWDYEEKTLTLLSNKKDVKPKIFNRSEEFDRNDSFISEVKNFIDAIENNKETAIPLQQAVDVLDISLNIKKSIGF